MNGNSSHDLDADDGTHDLAFALVDRTLTAIGGLATDDPMKAIDTVIAMYRRALEKLHEVT